MGEGKLGVAEMGVGEKGTSHIGLGELAPGIQL